ncbi:MAG TPA: TolC family protein [Chitinophagaceae bacterium]|nr:TolC family protein [Chitinophagaceae bacterium]
MKYTISRVMQLFVSLILLNSVHVLAQDTASRDLTLKDAIDLSVKNSKQLKNNLARIDEATAAVREAKDQRLPDFKVSGSYLRLNNPNITLKTKSGSGAPADSNSVKVSSALYGLANISYPLYSGMRIQYGIESAKYLEQAVKLDADNNREAVILNAISAYVNLYKSKAAVDLVKENLDQSKKRDTDFLSLEKNGILARNDLLKAQLQTANIELSLFEATSNWKLANVNMNIMLGLPENTTLIQDTTSIQASGAGVQSLEEYEKQALQNRKDMMALSYRKKAAGTGIKAAKGEYYPGIALTGGYVAADIPGLLTITNAVNIGVGVQYSLSSLWKTKAKVQQAKAREQQLLADEEALNDNVRYQINEAYEGYLLSLKKIDVYEEAINQATENYKITKNKYDNSLVTTTELLDADVAQLQAKLNHRFARADALVAYNKLLQSAGLLQSTK